MNDLSNETLERYKHNLLYTNLNNLSDTEKKFWNEKFESSKAEDGMVDLDRFRENTTLDHFEAMVGQARLLKRDSFEHVVPAPTPSHKNAFAISRNQIIGAAAVSLIAYLINRTTRPAA